MNNSSGLLAVCLIIFCGMMFFLQSNENKNTQPPVIVSPNPIQPPVIVNPPVQPPVIVNPPVQNVPNYSIEERRLYQLGYEDGVRGREKNVNFLNSPHYEAGYREGRRRCEPNFKFNINIK